jgi:hypothetical protein
MKLSIHPSVLSSIHGWHHTGKKTLAKINNPPSAHALFHPLGPTTQLKMGEKKGETTNSKPTSLIKGHI